jgi:hypothetical protein
MAVCPLLKQECLKEGCAWYCEKDLFCSIKELHDITTILNNIETELSNQI